MKTYDFLIIGAGSAGCNIAHYLQKKGKKIAIADKEGVAGGGSGAAGAFLSPLPGKENLYNTFINNALLFSLKFYEELSPNAIVKKGVLRVANENFDNDKLEKNSIENRVYDSKKLQGISQNFNNIEGYFYENAAILNPHEICKKLIEKCDFYKEDIKKLVYEDNFYIFENFRTKNIILAQGVIKPLVKTPYMEISPIFGVKIDIRTTTHVPFNIHKSISISANRRDGLVAIGATKERHDTSKMECLTSCEKCDFYVNSEQRQIETLLREANELIKLENLEVAKIYRGARATIKSYFPVIGKAVNYEESLKKYPSIKNGTKIPPDLLEYFPNLYLINALGSRGFVVAPYLAEFLGENILNNTKIPKELSSEQLFYKRARKNNP